MVLCFDKSTGDELWRRTAHQGIPRATRHTKASHANTTVAVSGENVVAFFGSEGLFCYGLDGELKWKKDLGVVDVSKYGVGWGYGSSPAIHDGHIVLVCDDPDNPYLIALRLDDGREIWRKERTGICERSWGTPLIHEIDNTAHVVVNGWPWVVAYDLQTGDEVWRTDKGGSYMSTPVVVDDYLYLGNSNGVLRCFHAVTGEKVYEKRLGSGAYMVSSLVAANDKIYCPSEDGTVYVIQAGPEYDVLAKNRLGDSCLATPAISAGTLYFRTATELIAIGPNDEPAATSPAVSEARKPNVLFIAVDDLRPTMGCYGDKTAITPQMDGLADRGMRFNRAYCQVAVCNPSRASLMTGLRPDTLGVWTLPIHFREAKPDAVTLPQWLRKHGYFAVSHGKIYHNPTPDPQSWSEPIRNLPRLPAFYPDGTRDVIRDAMSKLPANDWRKNNLRGPATAAPDLPDHQVLDGARTDLCIEDLRRLAKSQQPFFLAMGYIRPHLSFVAPKKYWDLYDPEELPVLSGQKIPADAPPYAMHNNSELSHYVDLINMPKPWDEEELSADQARRLLHGYHACVSYVDAQIGRLLKALDEVGLTDDTIVVLWSDHGWKLGEYRGWGKMTNYEIDARVPLIISAPMVKTRGQSTESLAALLDLYPTLCELTGLETPDFVEGKSLVPILRDPLAKVHQSVTSQYYRTHEGSEYMGYSMRTDRYRYIEWRDFGSGEIKFQELYDHSTDDGESGLQSPRVI
nr:sulfatase-like hydrolase/transferase [Rhodopirellula sp. JC639]